MNNRKQQKMNSAILAGDMVREVTSYLNAKDFKNLRNTCTFFGRQTFPSLLKRVQDQQEVVEIISGFNISLMLMRDGSVWFAGVQPSGSGINNTFSQVEGVDNVCQVAAGTHCIYLKKDGSVWVQGKKEFGTLGLADTEYAENMPMAIPHLDHVCQIASQSYHTLFLKKDGTVWACGLNENGQLGLGDVENRDLPTQIPCLFNIRAIYTGHDHSVFVRSDGAIFSCGSNKHGQLGLKTTASFIALPYRVDLKDVCQVSAGAHHTLFLKNDGSVWGSGWNRTGALGQETAGNYYAPTQIPGLQNICQVAAGYKNSMMLTTDGSVLLYGNEFSNDYLDLNNFVSAKPIPIKNGKDILKIALTNDRVFLTRKDGVIFAAGSNHFGKLGTGNDDITHFYSDPIQIEFEQPKPDLKKLIEYHNQCMLTKTSNSF